MRIETKCIHSGQWTDTVTKGINTPIFPSSAHKYLDEEDVVYPRYFNTLNQKLIVQKICDLEGGEDGVVFSSGMAAISSTLFSLLKSGDHVVLQDEIYGGSRAFVDMFFKRFKISASFAGTDAESIKSAITSKTRVIYIETPANPLLSIVNIQEIADMARRNGCVSIADNTFATPINQNPFKMGIDIVIHSGTKYLGGHSDLSCGAVVASADIAAEIRATAANFGGNLNALDCYMLERSLKTLFIRVKNQNKNAFKIAKFIENHSFFKKVYYPGLINHPGHSIARDQMNEFGAILSFELKDSSLSPDDFMKRLNIIKPAVSLGGIETTICDPARTSHEKISAEARFRQGISDSLLRLSVGIENADDLIEDIEQAVKI